MRKTNKPEVKPTGKTKFAKYTAIKAIADEKVGEMSSKNVNLNLQSQALAGHIQKRLNPKRLNPKNLSRQDRVAAEKMVAKQIQPMSSIIQAIRDNFDRPTQEQFQTKFDANFKSDKQFEAAMLNYMKGNEDAKFTKFLTQLSLLTATQEKSRIQQIEKIQKEPAVIKAEKVVKNRFVQFADKLSLKSKKLKGDQYLEKRKGERALVGRKGGDEEVAVKKGKGIGKLSFLSKMGSKTKETKETKEQGPAKKS